MSAFGGIVALPRPVTDAVAEELVANPQADVLIAPGFDDDALALFAAKRKNMRVLSAPPAQPGPLARAPDQRRAGWSRIPTSSPPAAPTGGW